jgi:NADH:ubiquinone oxidoreductase subunit 2 (subunit N)
MLQCIHVFGCEQTRLSSNSTYITLLVFLFSVLFKLGVTPLHLFKVEVYKGIPFLSIFFYSTYYFVVLFVLFLYLLSDFMVFFVGQYFLFLFILLSVGSVYVTVLLFDVSLIKAFFTYSTVISTAGFLIIFVSSF